MPYTNISLTEATDAYRSGTSAKARKWMDKFLATSGIADAAKSDSAQRDYEAQMTNASVLKKRQRKLAALSDEDFKAPVRAGGQALYSSATAAKAPKWGKNFAPYAAKIDAVVPGLTPATDDVNANIDNRVKPIANALRELSRGS